ncbi:MAG: PorT family protein [Tannerella sp.]|jgi:hypothetical protein|nr:PorT family protein [Tannerella sp.]
MKTKGLFLVLLLSTAAVANAQGLRLGVKGGLNVASVKFSQDVFDTNNITGFHLGPILEVMTPLPGIGFDGAILFTQKGVKMSRSQQEIRNNFIEVPVHLKWKLPLPLVKPYLAAGPYAALRVAGDSNWNEVYGDIVHQIKSKSFSAGLNFAAGAEIMRILQVSVNYNLGLTDNFSTSGTSAPFGYSGKTRTWVISAAVFF